MPLEAAIKAPPIPEPGPDAYTEIYPASGWAALKLGELWQYRELLVFLMLREIKVRYKQTAIGAGLGAVSAAVYDADLYAFFRAPREDAVRRSAVSCVQPTALVPWIFFANGLTLSSNSLVGNANLIGKVYFPRLLIPVASVFSGFVDFILAFFLLAIFCFYKGIPLHATILWLPLFLCYASWPASGRPLVFGAERGVSRYSHTSFPS